MTLIRFRIIEQSHLTPDSLEVFLVLFVGIRVPVNDFPDTTQRHTTHQCCLVSRDRHVVEDVLLSRQHHQLTEVTVGGWLQVVEFRVALNHTPQIRVARHRDVVFYQHYVLTYDLHVSRGDNWNRQVGLQYPLCRVHHSRASLDRKVHTTDHTTVAKGHVNQTQDTAVLSQMLRNTVQHVVVRDPLR
ncbi:hypothetical protein D3C84_700270 [compost metagenome]